MGEYYIAPRPHESWHASESPTRFDSFESELQKKRIDGTSIIENNT